MDFLIWYQVRGEFELSSQILVVQEPHHQIKISCLNPGISEECQLRFDSQVSRKLKNQDLITVIKIDWEQMKGYVHVWYRLLDNSMERYVHGLIYQSMWDTW